MKSLHSRSTALVLAAALATTACGTDDNTRPGSAPVASGDCTSGSLTGAGSTFQKNIVLQWIKDYGARCPGATIGYNGTGSGAGISQFGEGTIDFAGSDSLMKDDEQAKADARCGTGNKAIHLPVTAGAIVLTYNLKGVDGLQLSARTIAGIFQGAVKRWDDPAVKADNPGAALPSTPIQAVHRSDSSGTTDVFSKFLDAMSEGAWTVGTGKELKWPGGQAAKGSDGVTNVVSSTNGAITYTELSFATSTDLPTAKVRNASGAYVPAEGASVSKALESAKLDESKGDLRATIDFKTAEPTAYPISAVSYVIVCDKGNAKPAILKAFIDYAVSEGQAGADDLGYAPVPPDIRSKLATAVAAIA